LHFLAQEQEPSGRRVGARWSPLHEVHLVISALQLSFDPTRTQRGNYYECS
jgi:hypothetical protein